MNCPWPPNSRYEFSHFWSLIDWSCVQDWIIVARNFPDFYSAPLTCPVTFHQNGSVFPPAKFRRNALPLAQIIANCESIHVMASYVFTTGKTGPPKAKDNFCDNFFWESIEWAFYKSYKAIFSRFWTSAHISSMQRVASDVNSFRYIRVHRNGNGISYAV